MDIRIIPLEGSLLISPAHVFREMIDAYLSDGDRFLSRNDIMNAYASYWYAFGWLDAGVTLGLITRQDSGLNPGFLETPAGGSTEIERLQEKTTRYRSLLGRALESLDAAPEEGSSLFSVTGSFLSVAESCLGQGMSLEGQGSMAAALSAYSYGFAWLDAGVRFGLFRINNNRELFTV